MDENQDKVPTTDYAKRRGKGQCVRGCGRPASPGKSRCRWCKVKQNAYHRAWKERKRKEQGWCRWCKVKQKRLSPGMEGTETQGTGGRAWGAGLSLGSGR
jgi:hypothetical protein